MESPPPCRTPEGRAPAQRQRSAAVLRRAAGRSDVFALRVDCRDIDVVNRLLSWLEADGGAWFAVLEGGEDNPHIHAVLHSGKKIATLRQSFNRAFPDCTGNGAYSLTGVVDLDKYHRYMCKGDGPDACEGPQVVGAYGVQYTDEWLCQQHEAYWDENRAIAEAKKAKALPLLDEVAALCRDANVRWDHDQQIAALLIREQVRRGKALNTFALRSQVNLLKVMLCPDDRAVDHLAEKVANGN